VLDAKYLKINEVLLKTAAGNKKLDYTYDTSKLIIYLDKYYTRNDLINVLIDYVALPYQQDSLQVEAGRGMYFIDVEDKNPYKPMHMWTQGEEESSSCWFPTIDATNQKTTEEIYVTLDTNMISLSNGLLIDSKNNGDGTKTDHWKQDQPHSPYLFFLGIGDYFISKDKWRAKEVTAYTFPKYKKDVAEIFKNMPAMMEFFSQKLGVDFPWDKMANIMAYDYTAGAMENSSAIIYYDRMLCDHQQLGNLTVNESFADYSQTLWEEHSKGKDAGAYENYKGLRSYLSSPADAEKDLVRFYYKDREDMFDLVSYQKGGRILNMLRHFVGDEAFFASLNKYLVDNQFKNGSAIKLKLAFEAVTGKDLNWFFNQWYFGSGHPYVRITQQYDAAKKQVMVKLQQTQVQEKIFTLPIGIDVYVQGSKKHYDVWMKNKVDSFYFDAAQAPENVNVDNDKVLLWAKDESKPIEQYAYQFKHATNFLDRFEAVQEASENQNNPFAQSILKSALKDSFYVIRAAAMNAYNPKTLDSETEAAIFQMAAKDKNNSNREAAIDIIGALEKAQYKTYFINWTKDSSYSVAGAALEALEKLDSTMAKAIAFKESKNITKKRLNTAVTNIITKYGDESVFDFVADKYEALNIQSSEKFYMTTSFAQLLIKTADPIKFKKGIDLIVAFREAIPQGYRVQTDPYFNGKVLGLILKGKKERGEQALVDMVTAVLPKL